MEACQVTSLTGTSKPNINNLLLRLSKNPAMPAWNAAASELGLHGAGGGKLPLQFAGKGREDVWTTSTLHLPSHLILKIIS